MPVVSGQLFAESAYSYNGRGLTYQDYDCVHFTNLVRRTCALASLQNGTNRLYRGNGLIWKGTIQEARALFGGSLPPGLYLFHSIPDTDPDADPTHYGYGDGIGDVNHVGIYTGIGLGVMQSGGYGGTGVHESNLRSYFNLAGWASGIDLTRSAMPRIDNPSDYRKFWISPDHGTDFFGERCVSVAEPLPVMKQNANCVRSKFLPLNWSLQAICALLGNMQYDSYINPAYIDETNRHRLPDNGTNLNWLYNYQAQFFYGLYYTDPDMDKYGMGLFQWSTISTTMSCDQAKTVAYAISNHYNWYDGWYQCDRLETEHQNDPQYHYFTQTTYNGTTYTFANFFNSTNAVSDLSYVWQTAYLHKSDNVQCRALNAQYWYDYFTGPDAPPMIEEPPIPSNRLPEYDEDWLIPIISKRRKEYYQPCRRM